MTYKTGVIGTATGKKVNIFDPELDEIDIEDIANALSKICRFNGHISDFYSVAQHSVMVSKMLRKCAKDIQRHGLLHDADEAYLCDIPSPLKYMDEMLPYRRIARNFLVNVIYKKFHVFSQDEFTEEVKIADVTALAFEAREFFSGPTRPWVIETLKNVPESAIELAEEVWEDMGKCAWDHKKAKEEFLFQFHKLKD
jgi:hypothetical protein